MITETRHGPRFSRNAMAARVIKAFGLDNRNRDLAVESNVDRGIDPLPGALAKQSLNLVPATADRGPELRRRLGGRQGSTTRFAKTRAAPISMAASPTRHGWVPQLHGLGWHARDVAVELVAGKRAQRQPSRQLCLRHVRSTASHRNPRPPNHHHRLF
jgi:hypothetical protein